MEEYNATQQEIEDIQKILANFDECDPAKLDVIKQAISVAQQSHERWTDTIFTIAKYIKNRKGMSNSEFFKIFRLPVDLDYVE